MGKLICTFLEVLYAQKKLTLDILCLFHVKMGLNQKLDNLTLKLDEKTSQEISEEEKV